MAANASADMPGSSEQRKNLRLRLALERLVRNEYQLISDGDVLLLQSTQRQLKEMAETSPNQQRLLDLLSDGIPRLRPAPPPAEPPVEAPEPATAVQSLTVEEVLKRARKEQVRDLEEIPVTLNVLTFRHRGTLHLKGDIPDTLLVIVRQGDLNVEGFCFGHVLASGDVTVRDNIQGGWIVSLRGNIVTSRVLAGSRLIAPAGDLTAEQVQNANLMFSGGCLRVSGNLQGGQVHASTIEVTGAIISAKVYVLNELTLGSTESYAGDAPNIMFPSVITSKAYGQTLSDEMSMSLAGISRARFRVEVWGRLIQLTLSDMPRLLRVALYSATPRGAEEEATAASVRAAQCLLYHGEMLSAAMGALLRVMDEAIALGTDVIVPVVSAGVEEAALIARMVEKEIEHWKHPLMSECKNRLLSECKHLTNNARKLREAVVVRGPFEKWVQALERRQRELKAILATAVDEAERKEAALAEVLPAEVLRETHAQELELKLFTQTEILKDDTSGQAVLEGKFLVKLQEEILRHKQSLLKWKHALQTAMQHRPAVENSQTHGVVLYPRQGGARFAAVRNFDVGTTLSVQSLIADSNVEVENGGTLIRLHEAISAPSKFVIVNGQFQRQPWNGKV